MVRGAVALLTLFRQTLKKEKRLCFFPYFPFLAPTITHYSRSKLLIGDKCKEYWIGLYENQKTSRFSIITNSKSSIWIQEESTWATWWLPATSGGHVWNLYLTSHDRLVSKRVPPALIQTLMKGLL